MALIACSDSNLEIESRLEIQGTYIFSIIY